MKGSSEESGARQTRADRPAESALVEEQVIRERAYQIFKERCDAGSPGDPIMDWLEAEHELCDGRKRSETLSELETKRPAEKVPSKAW